MNDKFIPLEIPPFNDIIVDREEMHKIKDIFEKITIILRDNCDQFEIHLAYYAVCKVKENIIESMQINYNLIQEEIERRKNQEK